MSKIIIKIFLWNVAKQPYFLVGGILSESVVWQQTNIVLRMAWVKIIKLIPPYTSESLPEEILCLLGKVISRQHWYASLHCGPWARHIYPSLVLVQPRKNRPCLTERLLMGPKESNQTKLWYAKKLILIVPIATKFVLSSAECWNVQ